MTRDPKSNSAPPVHPIEQLLSSSLLNKQHSIPTSNHLLTEFSIDAKHLGSQESSSFHKNNNSFDGNIIEKDLKQAISDHSLSGIFPTYSLNSPYTTATGIPCAPKRPKTDENASNPSVNHNVNATGHGHSYEQNDPMLLGSQNRPYASTVTSSSSITDRPMAHPLFGHGQQLFSSHFSTDPNAHGKSNSSANKQGINDFIPSITLPHSNGFINESSGHSRQSMDTHCTPFSPDNMHSVVDFGIPISCSMCTVCVFCLLVVRV